MSPPNPPLPTNTVERLAETVIEDHVAIPRDQIGASDRDLLVSLVDTAFRRLPHPDQGRLESGNPEQLVRSTASIAQRWLRELTPVVLSRWLKDRGLRVRSPNAWLGQQSTEIVRRLLSAALRTVIGSPRDGDAASLNHWFENSSKETQMAAKYYIDDSAIPALRSSQAKKDYLAKVQDALTSTFGMSSTEGDVIGSPKAAAIVGFLLLDEEYDPRSLSFAESMKRAWIEALGKTPSSSSATNGEAVLNGLASENEVPNQTVYEFVSGAIVDLNGDKPQVSYQELASVARHAISQSTSIPFGHPNFIASVRIGLDAYVGGKPTGDSLTLPPGSLPGTGDELEQETELNGSNILAFGTVYAIALLQRTYVFHVVDRIAQMWLNGHLTIGFDAAGKAIDTFVWEAEDRFGEAARMSHFSRILGMPGGDVPKEVQPNRDYEGLFLRFVSSVAEYDRQRRVADLFENRTASLSLTGEQVRKSGRDVAANASLYGWGSAHFIARRLNTHLTRAIEILKLPQVQKAFGVTNPWQVVERVAISELSVTPNIVKYRTMAEASKAIFDLLARKTRELTLANSPRPFLYENEGGEGGSGDLSYDETQALLRAVQHWLAVNAVAGDQVQKLSQPSEANVPSLPNLGASRGDSSEVVNRLRQMVASGSAPSIDQLQQLIPSMR